jgi:hypothetical protein
VKILNDLRLINEPMNRNTKRETKKENMKHSLDGVEEILPTPRRVAIVAAR